MQTETEYPFFSHLARLAADTGKRAALRRYWSPTTRHQAYPVLGELRALRDERKAILAALYAVHPVHQEGQSLGKAAFRLGKREGGEHPYDRHFKRLLACDTLDDLKHQLHRLVKRLTRDGFGLDYESLYKDLNYWKDHSENVKVGWAADFWQAPIKHLSGEAVEA